MECQNLKNWAIEAFLARREPKKVDPINLGPPCQPITQWGAFAERTTSLQAFLRPRFVRGLKLAQLQREGRICCLD